MKTNLPVELLEKILEQEIANGEKLDKLAELKETQIENQVKFEKKWRMAKLGAMLAMAAAIATDVVKLSEDGQVIMDRAGVVVQKVIDMVKTIGD